MIKISPQQLQERLQDPQGAQPFLLDVRTPLEYREVHLNSAELIPMDQLDAASFAQTHGVDREVVVICRSGGRASKVAARLAEAGMSKVKILDGGVMAWAAANLPVVEGQKGMSLERQVRIAAGAMVLLGAILGTWVHPGFYGLCAFVGAGLVFAGLTDWCGMGLLLAKAPWNQAGACAVEKS